MKVGIRLTGTCPERALSRLSRQKIVVYGAVKTDAKSICFSVRKRDEKKVFALYPRVGTGASSAYFVEKLPDEGALKIVGFFRRNIGVLVGALCFMLILFSGDKAVLEIDVDAPKIYHAQVYDALEENGIKKYAIYKRGKEDLVCARLLALDGVSYCSVKKVGATLIVTLKTNSFFIEKDGGDFSAERAGKLTRIVALSGTPLVEVGEAVAVGQKLVEGRVYNADGAWRQVPVVAYAEIACTYERVYACDEEKEAFAKGYLAAGLEEDKARILGSKIERREDGYAVAIEYVWTQRIHI